LRLANHVRAHRLEERVLEVARARDLRGKAERARIDGLRQAVEERDHARVRDVRGGGLLHAVRDARRAEAFDHEVFGAVRAARLFHVRFGERGDALRSGAETVVDAVAEPVGEPLDLLRRAKDRKRHYRGGERKAVHDGGEKRPRAVVGASRNVEFLAPRLLQVAGQKAGALRGKTDGLCEHDGGLFRRVGRWERSRGVGSGREGVGAELERSAALVGSARVERGGRVSDAARLALGELGRVGVEHRARVFAGVVARVGDVTDAANVV
jgi:hypothetical protein